MRCAAWVGLVVALTCLISNPVLGQAGGSLPAILVPANGPEVPPLGIAPVASIHAFDAVLWAWSGRTETHEVALPEVSWNRVMLTLHSWPNHPDGDPWDRLLMVSIGGIQDGNGQWAERPSEVLRVTTPRTEFDVTEDITEYASILHGKEHLNVSVSLASYDRRGLFADVTIDFYNEPVAAGDHAFDRVLSPHRWTGVNGGAGATRSTLMDFGPDQPALAVVELFTSGHAAAGEFWWQVNAASPPRFGIFVDDVRIGTVYAMPYIYALLGFYGSTGELVHEPMWWTAQKALDRAGIHGGTGEIPAYRAVLPEEMLPLLTGERDVRVTRENHGGNWPTTVSFLMDDALV